MSCFPLSPDLRVTVNDREPVPVVARADCEWDVLVSRARLHHAIPMSP